MQRITNYFLKLSFLRRFFLAYCRKNVRQQMCSKLLRFTLKEYYALEIGMHSYGFMTTTSLPRGTKIGRYTSIAKGLNVFRRNHPLGSFSTHPYFYDAKMGYLDKDAINSNEENPLVIGNDVWIGSNVTILPGCKSIGDGAVIGACSVVTHDVDAFDIVVGNPAKKISNRMPKDHCRWWENEPPSVFVDMVQRPVSSDAEE